MSTSIIVALRFFFLILYLFLLLFNGPSRTTSAFSIPSTTMRQQKTRRTVSMSVKNRKKQSLEEESLLCPANHESMPQTKPKLLVFDLDNTLWTPELYQIRQRQLPRVNQDIWLFDDVKIILNHLARHKDSVWGSTELGIASRTHKGDWARTLMSQFQVNDMSLLELFPHTEIIKGSKRVHFENLAKSTGVAYSEMVFFDDDARMNLGEVSQMGVLCCHCPRGLSVDLFRATLEKYQQLKQEDANSWMGHTLNAANLGLKQESSIDEGRETTGRIKFFSTAKRFGFVVEDGGSGQDYFFHESKVADGLQVQTGMKVRFETATDGKGRPSAVILSSVMNSPNVNGSASGALTGKNPIEMPCFSMSQPFAALLLNGIKTVETRNYPMFANLKEGTKVLLHCGQRDWKDTEAPRRELIKTGYSESDIDKLSALPQGFSKGSIIGVMTVGTTWESTLGERSSPELQGKVVAATDAIGRFCTPITNAAWLKRPVKARGNKGVYTASIPKSALPDNFKAQQQQQPQDVAPQETKQRVWTISG